jgi:aspartate dehydrogenase
MLNPITPSPKPKVAVAGWGALGKVVVESLLRDEAVDLVAVSARNDAPLRDMLHARGSTCQAMPLDQLGAAADIVIECLSTGAFDALATSLVDSGKTLIVLSAAALVKHAALLDSARQGKVRLVVATGAIMGLDAVRALRLDGIIESRMVTRKPPKGLTGAPYVVQANIDLAAITLPTLIFSGSAAQAAIGFPANVNVAIALSLAANGPDHTQCEIWADPTVAGNVHSIYVKSKTVSLEMTTQGIPDPNNPRSSTIAAHSAVAALHGLFDSLKVGS